MHFDGVKIIRPSLKNAIFSEETKFINCVFEGFADFEGSLFQEEVSFVNCEFLDFVMFRGCCFPERANFEECHFRSGASFAAGSGVDAELNVVQNDDLGHMNFRKSTFSGYTTFNNREFLRSANFDLCEFVDPPHFQNTNFHSGTTFDDAVWLLPDKRSEKELYKIEKAFRRLKQVHLDLGDNHSAYDFAANELKIRQMQKIGFVEKALIFIYSAGSDFGRSLSKPFGLILTSTTILLLFCLYVVGIKNFVFHEFFRYSIQQIVSPFSVWGNDYIFGGMFELVIINQPTVFLTLSGIHTAMCLTAIGLLVHAVQRHFK